MKRTARTPSLQEKVLQVTLLLEKTLGEPKQSAKRAKPLDMLIATILSQNTNDQNSFRAFSNLKKQFPTWDAVRTAKTQAIASAIKTGGMANQKSVRIKNLLNRIYKEFGSLDMSFLKKKSNEEIFELLTSFDGVGTKTSACVLLFSLRREVFPVDTHVHRICNRLGFTPEAKTPDQTFEAMKNLVPEGKAYSLHTNLIRFGRKTCKAVNPLCGNCPLYDYCRYKDKEKYRKSTLNTSASEKTDFMLLDNVVPKA